MPASCLPASPDTLPALAVARDAARSLGEGRRADAYECRLRLGPLGAAAANGHGEVLRLLRSDPALDAPWRGAEVYHGSEKLNGKRLWASRNGRRSWGRREPQPSVSLSLRQGRYARRHRSPGLRAASR